MNSQRLQAFLRPPDYPRWGLWFVCVAALAASGWLGTRAYVLYDQALRQNDANALVAQHTVRPPTAKPSRTEQEAVRQWAELRTERDFPWSHVFQMIEEADNKDIELLGMTPDKRRRTVILRGQALNSQSLLAYLRALNEHPLLSQAYLLHQQAGVQNQLPTIGFEIRINLR